MIRLTTYLGNLELKIRYFIVAAIAIISSLILIFLVRQGGFFPSGFLGLSIALNLFFEKSWVFPLFMIAFNIPLTIFSYFKIGKKFAGLTLTYLIVGTTSYFLFANYIPLSVSLFELSKIMYDTGTRAIAAVVSGVVYGLVLSITYMAKGSAGGIDNLSMYYAIRKKNFGIYNMIISVTIMFTTVFISEFLKVGIENNYWNFHNIFNNTLFLTILFIGVTSISTHYAYPRYIKIAVKVFTNKGYQISRSLVHRNYPHKHTITIVKSPASNRSKTEIYIVVYYHQYVDLLKRINNIDENAFVTVTKLSQIRGSLAPPKLG